MKIPLLTLALACLFAGGFAEADTAKAPTMELLRDGTGAQAPRVYHAFGGRTLAVEAVLSGAPGTVLEVQADLLQKAQSLVVPVQKEIPLGKGIELGDALPHLCKLDLPVPEVKRESLFIAQFRVKTQKAGDWQASGQAILKVYPPDGAKESLAQIAREHPLQLFGTDTRLRDFLESRHIPFSDTGTELENLPPSSPAGTVFLGSAPAAQVARWVNAHPEWQGSMVVFSPDSGLLPGVFSTPQNGRNIVKVTLPLLETLSTDPRSQKTLVEIFKTTLAQ